VGRSASGLRIVSVRGTARGTSFVPGWPFSNVTTFWTTGRDSTIRPSRATDPPASARRTTTLGAGPAGGGTVSRGTGAAGERVAAPRTREANIRGTPDSGPAERGRRLGTRYRI